jgi:type IV secretory pathway VirB4 component
LRGGGLVLSDRFARHNYNQVILACSGAGKSYLCKLDALRSLLLGIEVAVIDPENEFARLAEAVGGTQLHLGRSGVRLNPLDLDGDAHLGPDALINRGLFVHTLVAVLLGQRLDATERACLDRAVIAAYAKAGITSDPRTFARPAPLLRDLAIALEHESDVGRQLAAHLVPFTKGTHRGLFDGPTTTTPQGHLVVFSLRDIPEDVKGVGTLLTLDAVWRRVTDPQRRRRRLVVVDEAWLLMRDEAGARFLNRLAKAGRKHWCGLTTVTQDAADLLGSDLGEAIVANAATQVLMRQAPQAIDALTSAFRLSEGERQFLLGAARGEGILMAGQDRVAFRALASPTEHRLVTSDPAELADQLEGAA